MCLLSCSKDTCEGLVLPLLTGSCFYCWPSAHSELHHCGDSRLKMSANSSPSTQISGNGGCRSARMRKSSSRRGWRCANPMQCAASVEHHTSVPGCHGHAIGWAGLCLPIGCEPVHHAASNSSCSLKPLHGAGISPPPRTECATAAVHLASHAAAVISRAPHMLCMRVTVQPFPSLVQLCQLDKTGPTWHDVQLGAACPSFCR